MVMSKKEQAMLRNALLKAEIAIALRWTSAVKPDIPIPEKGKVTSGWLYDLSSRKVYEAWSSNNAHGNMAFNPELHQYKKGITLYSTKVKALMALRHALEKQMAIELLKIDKRIIEETQSPSS